ncbi:putative 115 kDa protein in type-1 retrotransposable element R1DM [Dissostichus eleginoides]|uniref:115 kDa protein in type-1 retrotransposable element R1DM n=1 Tax=Dissostichus eleginoides TaxID=100907 RepID=A0AAD9BGT3_DISEL|nr:putative 115 kDa protein in type-1 retrotransposable element R1DM [Dissostichus eleginoides]
MAENAVVLEPLFAAKSEPHKVCKQRATRSSLTALNDAQRELQRTARSCANKYWNKLCDDIQQASDTGNLRELYRGLNKAIGLRAKKVCPLKSAEGALITDTGQQMSGWVEHYSELYAKPRSISDVALASTPSFDINAKLDNLPTMAELVNKLKHTAKGKAAGMDGIPADLLKCDSCLLPHMHKLLCQCWQAAVFPSDMKDAKIITLYKNKGNKGDCNNYRGISLLSVLGKVFSRILLVLLQKLSARVYPESQCGFRSGRSTTDMVFTARKV